jgi:hypothetical protein
VLQFSGVPKAFMSKAVHAGIRRARKGEYENATMLDANSLYPFALTQIQPPKGAPLVWREGERLEDYPYFIAEVQFEEVSFQRGLLGRMLGKIYRPGLKTVLDKTTLDDIRTYSAALEFTVLRGYVWREVSEAAHQKIANFIRRGYEAKRLAKTADERTLAKAKLNRLYGFTLKKSPKRLKRGKKGTWETQLSRNAPLIERVDEEQKAFYIRVVYDTWFQYTSLGVQILSQSHRIMYQLIARCDRLGIPIWHVHTDSLLIPTDRVPDFADCLSPDELGKLKREYDCSLASIVFSGRYTLTLTDGEVVSKGCRRKEKPQAPLD